MIVWIFPPFRRGDRVVIVLRNGKRYRADVTSDATAGGPWPPQLAFKTVHTKETFSTIGSGPLTVIGIGSPEEKSDDEG